MMNKKNLVLKSVLVMVLLMTAFLCPAQEELPDFPTERPGNTWGAEVLPLNKVSWENGFAYESTPDGLHTTTLNSTIVRYGIFENVELRLGTEFLMYQEELGTRPVFGVNPLTIGTKIKLHEGSGWVPSVGILAQLQSPHIGSPELLPSHLTPAMYLLFENDINDQLWLYYDAGLEWDGETATPTTFLSLCLGYSFIDDLGAFVETTNYLHPENGNQYLLGFGLYWMVSGRLQFDFGCNLDLNVFGKYYYLSGGVSWMIN